MEPATIVKRSLAEQFEKAMRCGQAVLFSAPCGFGKTTTAKALVSGCRSCFLTAGQQGFALPPPEGDWEVLLVDDLQKLTGEAERAALCRLLRERPDKRFVLLTRGMTPHWLMPFQLSGGLVVLGAEELAFDREAIVRLLRQYEVSVTSLDLAAIQRETKGCPLPLVLLAQHLSRGEAFSDAVADQVRRELFLYFEEVILRRLEPAMQQLLLDLAPFEPFDPDLARAVSGNSRAGELLGEFQRQSTALIQERLDQYRFWPIFRRFLLWEMEQTYDPAWQRTLYGRGGSYYEEKQDYGRALACYAKSGREDKISRLLEKNAEQHPGMGHYEEMEPYYRALPAEELRASPALMQGMSILCALKMDVSGSEKWYRALADFAAGCPDRDAARRDAESRLSWLDLSLPQRTVEEVLAALPGVFDRVEKGEIRLPLVSATSALPSLLNGSKDLSPWSRREKFLYDTMRIPAETVLGRNGVCAADCAVAENQFEKGENIHQQVLDLLSRLERLRREGSAETEFAALGLLARTQLDAGQPNEAKKTLRTLRARFLAFGEERFLPNLDAMLCRVDLYLGNDEGVGQWYREKAPGDPQQLHVLKRYQYLTQAMAELALGEPGAALMTLAPLDAYFSACRRYLDSIHLHILTAIARSRLKEVTWRRDLRAALDTAAAFGYIRPVSQYGGAVLPLLPACGWEGDQRYLEKLVAAVREQASIYPDYLRPRQELKAPLSPAELQVLRLICAGKSNAEIGDILGIKIATVKVHVNHIFGKLNARHRDEAREIARRLHLI